MITCGRDLDDASSGGDVRTMVDDDVFESITIDFQAGMRAWSY